MCVVIPALNAAEHLRSQLSALDEQAWDGALEVVVADNGSTDETHSLVTQWPGRIRPRLVDASQVPGPSAARNRGASATKSDVVLFCDADDIVDPGWLREMVEHLAAGPAIVGARRVHFDGSSPSKVSEMTGEMRLPMSLDFLPWTSGASLGVTRSVFEEIGGFDETMVRGEDIDFCWRAQLAGYPLVPVPDAIVHYRNRSSARAAFRQAYRNGRAAGDLLVRYRSLGARRRSLKRALRAWGWLLLRVPDLIRSPQARLGYCTAFGVSVGRIRGSLDNRVLCL